MSKSQTQHGHFHKSGKDTIWQLPKDVWLCINLPQTIAILSLYMSNIANSVTIAWVTNALYSDLAWSAVSEDIQPDSCKHFKSFLSLFTSNSVLYVEIINDEIELFNQLYHKIQNSFLNFQTSEDWTIFNFLSALVVPKPASILSSGKRFSLFERSIIINFFIEDILSKTPGQTNRFIKEIINLFKCSCKNKVDVLLERGLETAP